MDTLFEDGAEASRDKFVAALEGLQALGQSVLDDLAEARKDTLFRFQIGLSALNARRQRTARIKSPDVACQFVVSDLIDVDQSRTSATLRPDAQAVTLRERSKSSLARIREQKFLASTGIVEEFNGMHRVYSETGQNLSASSRSNSATLQPSRT